MKKTAAYHLFLKFFRARHLQYCHGSYNLEQLLNFTPALKSPLLFPEHQFYLILLNESPKVVGIDSATNKHILAKEFKLSMLAL